MSVRKGRDSGSYVGRRGEDLGNEAMAMQTHVAMATRQRTTMARRVRAMAASGTSQAPPKPGVVPQKDVRVLKLLDGTVALRGNVRERFKFEVEYGKKRGTTDNAYIVRGENASALIDVPDRAFADAFIQAVEKEIGVDKLQFLIVGHFSPKRMDTLMALLKARSKSAPPLQIICSNPSKQLLLKSLERKMVDFFTERATLKAVRTNDPLDLGSGHMLTFITTPTPRWPDALCTYDNQTGLLFSNKFFGCHACDQEGRPGVDIGGWDEYGEDWNYYYECLVKPVAKQASVVLDKLNLSVKNERPPLYKEVGSSGVEGLEASLQKVWDFFTGGSSGGLAESLANDRKATGKNVVTGICPMHGPVVERSLQQLLIEYGEWNTLAKKMLDEVCVAVIYASAYGNTAALANALSRGITKAGVGVESLNCELSKPEEVEALIERCGGFAVGAPTLGGHMPTPMQMALGEILKDCDRSYPCGVFGSFGWSGEAVDEMESRLKDGGFTFAFDPIRCKFKPTEATLQLCEESGTDLAQAVKKANNKKGLKVESQYSVDRGVAQAVGRVVGSLCVLSAKSGDAKQIMLASWVSQASFDPPGLTVAVAKERAVESLVLEGGKFNLSMLAEGKAKPIVKELSKPYRPQEDRSMNVATEVSENNQCLYLKDAVSYVECTVKNRLEAGDHYILYATVDNGKLLDEGATTAVHFRRSGSNY